ncbi:hypothetical protein L208DRAFT_1331550, partial [Tricholoma matsutake]
ITITNSPVSASSSGSLQALWWAVSTSTSITSASSSMVTSPISYPSPVPSSLPLSGKWPKGQYVVDMSLKFAEIDQLQGMSLKEHFEAVFQEHFVSVTYYDQWQCWAKATEQQHSAALAAGHMPAGRWVGFSQGVPLR